MSNDISRLQQLSVLYVEDEADTREVYRETLSFYVENVVAVASAGSALDMMAKEKFDVLITDIDLGGKDGITLSKEVRNRDKKIRIVVLTAYAESRYLLPAVELDITRYLVKPIDKSMLLGALNRCADYYFDKDNQQIFLAKDLLFNLSNRQLFYRGVEIPLRRNNAALMHHLVINRNKTVPYEVIANILWGDECASTNAIRCQIKRLRESIPANIIKNTNGVGYKLVTN